MRTITTEVYAFEELTPEAKEKAIENNRDFNTAESWWSDCVIEDRQAKLSEYGFYEPKILYSGFWSQGDGACFTSSLDNDGVLQFLTKTKELSKYPTLVRAIKNETIYCNVKITHNDRYYHAYSTNVEDYTEMQDNGDLRGVLLREWTDWFSSFFDRDRQNARIGWYVDECNDIYRHLEKEYEYQTDDDSIAESLIANEMEFTSDGKIA